MALLNFEETKKLLRKYKIPLCKTKISKSKEQTIKIAEKIGYPLVLKIAPLKIVHKTKINGVKTGIKNEKQLKKTWDNLSKVKEIEGILIQETLSGREVVLGIKRDPQLGSVLMFGLGGIFVEVVKDVSFRICPVSKKQAEKMVKEIKGYPVLSNEVNIKQIIKIIVNLSKLARRQKKIKEIDLNPVIVNEKKAIVVDAKIIV